jgi:membrane-associated phospholipid phosphatase
MVKSRWILLWAAVFVAAVFADVAVATWAHNTNPAAFTGPLRDVFWWLGKAHSTFVVAVVLLVWHRWHWRAALVLAIAVAAAGLACFIAKWMVGRTRPFKGEPPFAFHPFIDGLPGMVRHPNLAFPSGHACLAFATATCLAQLLPRSWKTTLFVIAALVSAFRLLESAHYPSDIVAGALLGVVTATLVMSGCRKKGIIPAIEETV